MYWGEENEDVGRFETAQICINGHVITDSLERSPEAAQKRCHHCGKQTISACPSCQANLRGYHNIPGVVSLLEYQKPAFCFECGEPFPWTATALDAARALAAEAENLTGEERAALSGSLDDLIVDTPRTQLAVVRFKKLAARAGAETAAGLRNIIIEIVSETAKRALFGP